MERFTISLDAVLATEFDTLIKARGYSNRSEAVRDMLRTQLEAFRRESGEARHCVANLSYVYNHHERDLAERLTHLQHDHHNQHDRQNDLGNAHGTLHGTVLLWINWARL